MQHAKHNNKVEWKNSCFLYCHSHRDKRNAWLQSSMKVSLEELKIFMNCFRTRSGPSTVICTILFSVFWHVDLSVVLLHLYVNKRQQYYNVLKHLLLRTRIFLEGLL
jgi:hypothetical protein